MLRMPPWTTWTVMIAVSIYGKANKARWMKIILTCRSIDLFAVLCEGGPLKMLVNIAEERQENIPALIYSAGMASFDDSQHNVIGGYKTQESSPSRKTNWTKWLPSSSTSQGYHTVDTEDVSGAETNEWNELSDLSRNIDNRRMLPQEDDDEDDDELNAIKLGLGDFIFYSVLVGKASQTDPVTLCLCIISILTGLSITILILTLNRRALPALPISILFGSITYAIAYYMTSDMMMALSLQAMQF